MGPSLETVRIAGRPADGSSRPARMAVVSLLAVALTLAVACGGEDSTTQSSSAAVEPPVRSASAPSAESSEGGQRNDAAARAIRARPSQKVQTSANKPPVIRGLRIVPGEDAHGDPVWRAEASAEDPEGDPLVLHYVWYVNGTVSDETDAEVDPSSFERGDRILVEVYAHDGFRAGPSARTGVLEISNLAPEITSRPTARIGADGVYRYDVDATDPEGDEPLRYELTAKPTGMSIEAYSGAISWRPTGGQAGTHRVEVKVKDRQGAEATQIFDLPIVAPEAASPAAPY